MKQSIHFKNQSIVSKLFPLLVLKSFFYFLILLSFALSAQNSMVGDGFGGRLWYKPTNYRVGSYNAFSVCYTSFCLNDSNQLYGWGRNTGGTLGYNPFMVRGVDSPTPVPGMANVKYVTAGYNMAVIKNDSSGWVMGGHWAEVPIKVMEHVYFAGSASQDVSFVKGDGTVWTVGYNTHGVFGDGTKISSFLIPRKMTGITNAVRVANSDKVTVILLSDGTVKTVGLNDSGLLGIDSSDELFETLVPINVPGLNNIVDVKATSEGIIALDDHGDVFAWGGGYPFYSNKPKKLTEFNNIVAISCGYDGNMYLLLDKDKNCFDASSYYIPVVEHDVIDILAGESFGYIVKSDGSLWGVGESSYIGSSIWLNLSNERRTVFTKITPELLTCSPINVLPTGNVVSNSCLSSFSVSMITGSAPFQYDIGAGKQSSPVFSGLADGVYTVTITDNQGCVHTDTVSLVSVGPTITVNSPSICLGKNIDLLASGALSYTWSTGSNSNPISVSPVLTSTYNVVGADSAGCINVKTATVTVLTTPTIGVNSPTVCSSENAILQASGVETYTWSTGSLTYSTIVSPTITTTYTVDGKDSFGCAASQTVAVDVLNPIADFTGLDSNYIFSDNGFEIELQNTSVNSNIYQWTFCNSTSIYKNPKILLTDTGNCCVQLTSKIAHCKDSVTKCFRVDCVPSITIPNVFTPNADGVNELFKIKSYCINEVKCTIFDRWGLKLHEWEGLNGYWDGTSQNGPATSGTYYYTILYTDMKNNKKAMKGFITLFRD